MRAVRPPIHSLLLALALAVSAAPASPAAEPTLPQSGLVLWLDAADPATLTADAEGRVERWADKSGQGLQAVQPAPTARPKLVDKALGGKAVVRFEGSSHLNLGRHAALAFQPGNPFTVVAAFRTEPGQYGTLLAKGGGQDGTRACHLYTAPGRVGAVVHGARREAPLPEGPCIAVLVCDTARAEVFADGRSVLRFAPGRAAADVDVLVAARRDGADNSGTFWPLVGDLAELLVYNRALDKPELDRVDGHLRRKYALPLRAPAPEEMAAGQLAAIARTRPAEAAEALLRAAERNKLTEELAALGAELLRSGDPFARGMAEWALAMKVGGENNGQQVVWPGARTPAWYQAYAGLPHAARLEADWVRQAVALDLHRDTAKLLADVDAMRGRAARMAEDFRRRSADEANPDHALQELIAIRAELAACDGKTPSGLAEARRLWLDARRAMRRLVLANPDLDFRQIVFLKQFAPHTVRNITRSYPWKHKPGGDIYILGDLREGGPASPLLDGRLGPGYVWGLDLWWDADRVVFSYARLPNWPPPVNTANYAVEGTNVFNLRKVFEPLHLYEARLDGSQIVQLTDHPYWSDFEPTYCANGDVVFASDRCGRSAECGNDTYDHTNPNLYILSRLTPGEGPGVRAPMPSVRKFTDSKDIDRYPHSLDDGRIAYTHWEYQERHFMEVHALWTARPDGTQSDALFKHHMRAPLGLRDTRSVTGSAKLVSIATGHHTFAYGPVVVVDPAHGMNSLAGLRVVTPGVKPQEGPMAGSPVDQGGVRDAGGLYQTPWALSETCFLVSYAYARPNCTGTAGVDSNGFGLYLIDAWGNRELLTRDPVLSCAMPIPLKKRPRPPIVGQASRQPPSERTEQASGLPRNGEAVCYVPDVYDGAWPEIERGSIRAIRIAQRVPWPFDAERGQQDYIPGDAGARRIDFQDWAPVRVIGAVPVESDGSVHFTVPADTAIYFQALDERGMEVLRMRSFVSFKEGEVRGCRGCHESQARAPAATRPAAPGAAAFPVALHGPPRAPEPPPWGAERLLGYEWLVQPVLDRHCTSCHGAEKPDGGIDLSATRAADGLLQSYRTMFGLRPGAAKAQAALVSCSNRFGPADVTRPREFGSHRSPLVRVLLDDPLHRDKVKLGPEDWTALVTWVDANAPYFDGFLNKRPTDGGPPRREAWTAR